MFPRMVAGALLAGGLAGLLAALLHFAFVQPLILTGEAYETAAVTQALGQAAAEGHAADAHGHVDDAAAGGMLQRDGMTALFSMLIYVAYAMVLVAGFGAAAALGIRIGPREGLLWGIAGFAAFQLWPAMGLAPDLPGTAAADLAARQVWWWGTALAAAAALALLGYGRRLGSVWWTAGAAILLLALPHVIGAPVLDGHSGVAPPEVAAAFAARVLGVGLAVWACLGWLAGLIWSRDSAA